MEKATLPEIYGSDVLKSAIDKWGTEPQIDMAIEEMSELIQALCKEKRQCGNVNQAVRDNIKEEIADVLIMLYQMIDIFGSNEDIEEIIKYKTNRLAQKLKALNG